MIIGLGSLRIGRAWPAVAVCAIAIGAAQGQTVAEPGLEGVTVEAARIVEAGHNQYGGPKQEISIRRGVKYSDLDLATKAGVDEFKKRIDATAVSLCAELDHMYPLESPEKKDCVARAEHGAWAEAQKIIDAKKGGTATK